MLIILCPQCGKSFEKAPGALLPFPCAHCGSNVLGPYCDLTLIGGGAMGNVYRARRPDMGNRTVAIKAPKFCSAQITQRFEREIVASARLEHANIVRAFDRGEIEGQPYLVMEFVNGRSLSEMVKAEHPLSAVRVARIIRDVAAGLEHADSVGMVNRDIKPENILVDTKGAAKILDYGLALLPQLDGAPDQVTRPGVLLGTTGYMAPEQASDPHGVTILADVYSLGCTVYFALARELPFQGAGSAETLIKHAHDPRPSVRTHRPDVDQQLDWLVQRMMAVDPKERPSPQEIIDTLDQMLPALAGPRSATESAGASEDIEAVCPECGDVYQLRAETSGRLFVCRNGLCGARFRVEPRRTSSPGAPTGGQELTREFLAGDPTEFAESKTALGQVSATATVEETRAKQEGDVAGIHDFERDIWASQFAQAVPEGSGQPAPLRGEPLTGEPLSGEPVLGEPLTGEPLDGEPLTGEPWADESLPGEVIDGEPLTGEPLTGEPISGEPFDLDAPSGTWRPQVIKTAVAAPADADFARDVLAGATQVASGTVAQSGLPTVEARQDETAVFDIPESSIVGEPAAAPVAKKRSRYFGPALAVVASLVLMAGAYGAYELFRAKPKGPEERWQEIQTLYQNHQWPKAEKEFKAFPEEFPNSPRVAEVPFFLDMCKAGREVYSTTGDAAAGLKQLQANFLAYRDQPVYPLYCTDLFNSLAETTKTLLKECQKTSNREKLASAREAHGLLTTVAEETKKHQESAPQTVQELAAQITTAERGLEVALAKKQLLEIGQRLLDPAVEGDEFDSARKQIEEIQSRHSALVKDKDVTKALASIDELEPKRVRYVPDVESEEQRAPARMAAVERVVWDEPAAGAETGDRDIVFALAHGILYAFDENGNDLWARRLGIDSNRLPIRVKSSAALPAMAIAVSTLGNSLVALDPATGNLIWRYEAGEGRYLAAPPTLVETPVPGDPNATPELRGLLPTADGEVHVLELVRGKRIGKYVTGFPMTNEGVYDPATKLAFFPADSERLFALDPATIDGGADSPAAASVLYTGHASGSLRSRPIVVDKYLILIEAAELERTRVRAFLIRKQGFPNPKSPPIKELVLRGWSWFTPPSTPDRITVVTDEGDLGVFGLNLDNHEEALYLLIKEKGACPRLPIQDAHRTLAIHSEEHLLWLMAGGSLRQVALDLLNQKVAPLWPNEERPAEITGVPVHEATMDETLSRLFVATQSGSGDKAEFAAVNADTGEVLWRRQLGINPVGDPIPLKDGLLVVDRTGRAAEFSLSAEAPLAPAAQPTQPPAAASAPAPLRISMQHELPPGAVADDLMRLSDISGQNYLAAAVDEGSAVAIRKVGAAGDAAWTHVQLPAVELQGRPAIVDGFLVAPCSDRQLYRIAIGGDARPQLNEQTYSWAKDLHIGPDDRGDVYPLPGGRVLVVHGPRLTWLEYKSEAAVKRWEKIGEYDALADVQSAAAIAADAVIVTTAAGRVLRIAGKDRTTQTWKLPGRITSSPQLLKGRVVLVTDRRQIVSLDPQAAPEMKPPNWTSGPYAARICGAPVASGDQLLVTDEGGQITGLDAKTGDVLWRVRLARGAMPAAAATPLSPSRLLVPLRDGTVIQTPLPQTAPEKVAGVQT